MKRREKPSPARPNAWFGKKNDLGQSDCTRRLLVTVFKHAATEVLADCQAANRFGRNRLKAAGCRRLCGTNPFSGNPQRTEQQVYYLLRQQCNNGGGFLACSG